MAVTASRQFVCRVFNIQRRAGTIDTVSQACGFQVLTRRNEVCWLSGCHSCHWNALYTRADGEQVSLYLVTGPATLMCLQCFDTVGWAAGRASGLFNLSCGVLAWLSIWSEVQTCIWPSWCHCHSLFLASVKSRLVFPFWYRLTRVVLDKGPLNVCVCVCYVPSTSGWLGSRVVSMLDSGAEGPGFISQPVGIYSVE